VGGSGVRYITPKTQDFAQKGTPWTLKPPEGKKWEVQAVTMTFDDNISIDKDMIIRIFANGADQPVKEHRYSDLIDWIETATSHTRFDGLLDSSIHKFYINFGEKIELSEMSYLSHLTIEVAGHEAIKAQDGGVAKRARGQYIISEEDND